MSGTLYMNAISGNEYKQSFGVDDSQFVLNWSSSQSQVQINETLDYWHRFDLMILLYEVNNIL